MKKLVLVFSFLFVVSFAFGQNLITNPGFESWIVNGAGGPPDNWSLSGSSITATQEATTIHGGTYSTNLTWTTSSTRYLQQLVDVTAVTNYRFSFWVLDNDTGGRARVVIRWYNSSGGFISGYYGGYTTDSPDWQLLDSGIQESPATADSANVEIRVYDISGWPGTATVYVDDANFEEITGASINNAYSISGTAVDVNYSADLTSVDPADYLLTGTADITFTGATIDGSDSKLVHLTGASSSMVGDTTLDNIDDSANTTDYDFYAGIMPIANTNTNNPGGHIDNTHLATYQGIVSANDEYNNVWISDASGAYNGVMIYDSGFDALVSVGDEILFTAIRAIYNSLTELTIPSLLSTISSGNTPYGPDVINGSDISETLSADTNPGETWEGQLVKIQNLYVDSYVDYDYKCTDDGGTTYFHVGDNVDYHFGLFSLTVGETYQEIVGVVDWYNSGPYYRINPRDNDDQILPVTLTNFFAEFVADNLTILWTTQSENNNLGWNIYRGESDFALEEDNTIQINVGLIVGAGTTSEPTNYEFIDEYPVETNNTYWYWLESISNSNDTEIYGPTSLTIPEEEIIPPLPTSTKLYANYPNPFNPETTIDLAIKEGEIGTLSIYNAKGQLIESYKFEAGEYNFEWDASFYSSGVYFYKLESESYYETKKMLMIK